MNYGDVDRMALHCRGNKSGHEGRVDHICLQHLRREGQSSGSLSLGLAGTMVAGLLIQSEVSGVAGIDVATLSGSAALLAVAMLLASILPARRAARLAPYAVLRED